MCANWRVWSKKSGFTPTHEGDFSAKTALILPVGKNLAVFDSLIMHVMREQLTIVTLRSEDKLEHVYEGGNQESGLLFTTLKTGMYHIYIDWHGYSDRPPTVLCKLWPEWVNCPSPEIIGAKLDKDGEGGWRLEISRQRCWIEGAFVQYFDANQQLQRRLSLSLATAKTVRPFVECFLGSFVLESGQDLINLAIEIHTQEGGQLMN